MKGDLNLEAPEFTFLDVHMPVDQESPVGMQVVFANKEDGYLATYIPDIEFASFAGRALRINLLIPTNGTDPFPIIVFIQGSAWFAQNRHTAIPQLSDFAHRGYVVASVEHRHSLEAEFPAQIQDVKSAIRFLRAHSSTYRIDPERVAIWGDSSGGHLAALVGVSEGGGEEFETDAYPEQSSGVKAVVDFYGPTDFLRMSNFPSRIDHDAASSPESLLIGGPIQQHREKATKANPIAYISKDKTLPPFLIMHGDQDDIVPFNQSVLLYQALIEARQDVTFYKVKGGGHGSRFWTPEVIEIVQNFLDAYV